MTREDLRIGGGGPRRTAALGLGLAILAGCSNQVECDALAAVEASHVAFLTRMKGQAAIVSRLEGETKKLEADTTAALETLGYEGTDDDLKAKLLERANARGAKLAVMEGPKGLPNEKVSPSFVITYDAAGLVAGVEAALELAREPPFFQITTVVAEDGQRSASPKRWSVWLRQPPLDRVPIPDTKAEIEPPPDADTVPERVGFCGAEAMRQRIATTRAEAMRLKGEAERLTSLLPRRATTQGIARRLELLREQERESQRIMRALVNVVVAGKLRLKALGFEEPYVVLELHGGKAERAALDRTLGPDLLAKVKELPGAPGVVRLGVPNEVSRRTKRDIRGATREEIQAELDRLRAEKPGAEP